MPNSKYPCGDRATHSPEKLRCCNVAQELLFQHNERLGHLAKAISLIQWEACKKDRTFSYVSDRAVAMTGFPLKRWYQKNFWENHLHPDDREKISALCLDRRNGHKEYELEYRMLTADDRTIWVQDIISVGNTENGAPILRGFLMDVTENKELQERILEITELEQRRLGQDLHDHLGQHLNGVTCMSKSLENSLLKSGHPAAQRAREITEQLKEVGRQAHILTHNRFPALLESNGLISALQYMAKDIRKNFKISCKMLSPEPYPVVRSRNKALQIYRIAQEAVQNAIKHGNPASINISFNNRGEETVLQIENDGERLPLQYKRRSGLGLHIMRSRAAVIGGRLEVKNRAATGVSVTCFAPRET